MVLGGAVCHKQQRVLSPQLALCQTVAAAVTFDFQRFRCFAALMADEGADAAADTHDIDQLEPAAEDDFEFSENRVADAATAEDPAALLSESAAEGLPAEETEAENADSVADLSEPQHWGGSESKADLDDFRQVDADASTGLSEPQHWGRDSRAEDNFDDEQQLGYDAAAAADDADDLPIFANEQSKVLNAEIKAREARAESTAASLTEHIERVRVMEEHLKNVRQEVDHTNALMEAKRKEISTEEHLQALASREAGRYAQELRRLDSEAADLQDKLNSVQNAMFSANEVMDQFKLQMNWNQGELEQWALAARQKEDDGLALQRYTRADEARAKELSLQIEKLSQAAVEKTAVLEGMSAAAAALQVELDRTAEAFRALHSERQGLVQQWQETILAMRRRDEDIAGVGEAFALARQRRAQRHELLQQNAQRLKMQADDNAEVKARIELLERLVAKRRQEQLAAAARLQEFVDELEVVRNTLASGAVALARKRSENSTLAQQLEGRKEALETARRRYQAAKRKVEAETGRTDSAEAAAKRAEGELRAGEADLKAAVRSMAALKDTMFKESQKLYVHRQGEADMIARISGGRATLRNLASKVHALDAEQMRQQELIYTAEFQIQQMERKVARGMGERSDEEKLVLTARISELEAAAESAREQRKMLTGQARNLNNELRAAVRRRESAQRARDTLTEGINELELECAAAEGGLKRARTDKEDAMVQTDVLRLEVQRLRDALNGRADEVFTLENRRQQLAMSMEERKGEIAAHKDVQRAALRAAEDERHRVHLELGQRKQAVEKLRAKFEILTKGFATPEGLDVGGDRSSGTGGGSQAYYIIAAAQRREELQREGDELDQEIRKCETEIRALETTLQHLNARNVDFRVSFQKADPEGNEADLLKQLEQQSKQAQDALFRKKKELQRLHTDFEEDRARLETVDAQAARLRDQNSSLENALQQVQRDLAASAAAGAKAEARLQKARAGHRQSMGSSSGSETLAEKSFRAEALRETAATVLHTLGQLAREFPELHEPLHAALARHSLTLPKRPSSGAATGATSGRGLSSRGGSRGSSDGGYSSGTASSSGALSHRTAGDNGSAVAAPMRQFAIPL
jgi:coiled-coil domain-containing protein 39